MKEYNYRAVPFYHLSPQKEKKRSLAFKAAFSTSETAQKHDVFGANSKW